MGLSRVRLVNTMAARDREVRVLHVVETLDVGGAEAVVASMANNASPGFRVDICCLVRSGPIAARIRPSVGIIEMGKTMTGNDYALPFRLAHILRSRKIDIVQSHDWGTLLETAAAATLAGTNMIHMAHGPTAHYPREDRWRALKGTIRRKLEWVACAKSRCAIAVSHIVRQELIEEIGIPARKVALIHNGIHLTSAPAGDLTAKRHQLGLLPDDLVLVAVGRLAEIKNYRLLLEALARAIREAPTLKLIMVGDGPERSNLEATVARLGVSERVHLLGERADVGDWLALGDVFVLPSYYEGISIALLEAMAAGLPAVVTRVGGNPEVVADRESGLLVDSGDTEGFARALVVMFREPPLRKAMGQAARARVEKDFDLMKAVGRYEEIYRDCLSINKK